MASSSSSSPEISASRSRNHTEHFSLQDKLHEVLEDLSSRFILNLPDEELASLERVCFQVEQAHWYYEDFIREQDDRLPTMSLKKFSNSLFHVCPLLKHWGDDHEQAFQSFLAYKTRVPVCGAIMLNETWDKCLLVKGWKSTSAWSFPKGKINEQEPRHRCAVREVLEETGFDLELCINPEDVVEVSIKEQTIALYIVPNIPENFEFKTRTRKEISKISWFKLTDLPTWKRNKTVAGKFYLITPFIGPLKKFIRDRKPRNLTRKAIQHPVEYVDTEVHVSSDEDPHGATDSQSTHAQEDSSQASSAELQTPSPQYSEPSVATYEAGTDAQDIDLQNCDSHLARILSTLTLSASTVSIDDSTTKVSSEVAPPSSTTPLSRPETLRTSHSSRTPSVVPRSVQPSPSESVSNVPAQGQTSHPAAAPSVLDILNAPRPPPIVSPSRTADIPLSGPPQLPSSMPVQASPYSSRASATSDIPKEVKYRAMLERMVQETERLATPKLERQNFLQLGAGSLSPSTNGLLASSASAIPHATNFNVPPAIYSSNPVGLSIQSRNQSSTVHYVDSLTVRPQTSNSFHPIPYSGHLTRASMDNGQLRSIMSSSQARAPATQPAFPPSQPFLRPQPSQGTYPASLQFPRNDAPMPSSHVPSHEVQAGNFGYQLLPTTPNYIPPPRNPAAAHLLNLLNSPSPNTLRATPAVAPPHFNNRN